MIVANNLLLLRIFSNAAILLILFFDYSEIAHEDTKKLAYKDGFTRKN